MPLLSTSSWDWLTMFTWTLHCCESSARGGVGGIFSFPLSRSIFFLMYLNHIPVTYLVCIRIQKRILKYCRFGICTFSQSYCLNMMPFSYSYSILVTWCKDLPEHTFLINLKKIRSLDFYIKCFFINVPWYQTLNVSPFSLKGFPGEFILVHFNWMQSMGIFNSYKIKLS